MRRWSLLLLLAGLSLAPWRAWSAADDHLVKDQEKVRREEKLKELQRQEQMENFRREQEIQELQRKLGESRRKPEEKAQGESVDIQRRIDQLLNEQQLQRLHAEQQINRIQRESDPLRQQQQIESLQRQQRIETLQDQIRRNQTQQDFDRLRR